MSVYQDRIQGADRLLRVRRTRKAVYAGLLALAIVLIYLRLQGEGASIKPFFLPLNGVLEVGLILGLVGTGLGLYFRNLEMQRVPRESQRYLMAKYSMSRALTSTVLAVLLGALLILPPTAQAATALMTPSPRYLALSPSATEAVEFLSPDAFALAHVTGVRVTTTSGNVLVTILRDNVTWGESRWVNATNTKEFPIEPQGWSSLSNWTLVFRNSANAEAAVSFQLHVAVMATLFSTVPFLLFLYAAANLGFWVGVRPIRERAKAAALYAGGTAEMDMGERVYAEYAMTAAQEMVPSMAVNAPPPPPPTYVPPPPSPAPAASAPAPASRPEPRPMPSRPETADSLVAKASALMFAQQYPSALVVYDEALRLDPGHIEALQGKASALLAMNEPDGALEVYRRILEIQPDGSEEALKAMAKILAGQARWREALETVESYLRKRPNDPSALELKGDILTSLGRRPEALAAFEAAQALDPANLNVRQKIEEVRVDVPGLLSRALIASASGNYAQALHLFDDILEVEPSNVNALIGKAVAYRRSGKPQEALNCLDLVLNIQPNNAAALLNRGHLLEERGDLEGALEAFDRLVTIAPADEEAWVAQGDVLAKMGRDDDALRAYAEALKLNPGDEETQRKIKELEASRSVHADVLQELYKVRGIGPARAKALIDAGYRTAEDFQKATVEQLLAVKGITQKIAEDLVKHFRGLVIEAH